MEHWMLWGKRVVDGAITVGVVVCVLLCALLCSLLIPPRLVMSYSKDPDMGTQYFYLTVKYYIVTASISAVIRRVVRRETSKQRAVSGDNVVAGALPKAARTLPLPTAVNCGDRTKRTRRERSGTGFLSDEQCNHNLLLLYVS